MEPLLSVKDLSKTFPGVKALSHMHFDLYPGEVHILAGENGAGKSTLSKCILGYQRADQGRILLCGEEVSFSSPREALAHGISAVYQELTLVPWLDAAQNIFFNREPLYPGTPFLNRKKMLADARKILSELGGGDLDVTVPVRQLGIAGQQMVEIAKALAAKARIIVFDEATASLTENQAEALFKKIDSLKKEGVGMIYISHRLQEYRRIGDRVTVMRDGRFIGTGTLDEIHEKDLVRMMVGRDVDRLYVRNYRRQDHPGAGRAGMDEAAGMKNRSAGRSDQTTSYLAGEEENRLVLRAEDLCDRAGKVKSASLTVHRGEIVGIAGLVGAGRTELARLLFGIDPVGSGRVLLHGEDVTGISPGSLIDKGFGLLPEDRKGRGLMLRASLEWNVSSASLKRLFPDGLIRKKKEEEAAASYMDRLAISAAGSRQPASFLSGGNQQKVVMAKWLLANADVMIFDEPTRGIDVGAKAEIYRLMDRMTGEGKSILMISSELPELLGMCDRIYAMREGRICGCLPREEFSEEKIGELMFSREAPSCEA